MATGLLDLPQDQFMGALDELGIAGARRDELIRAKRNQDSMFGGLFDFFTPQPGMERANLLPMMRPQGMSGLEAITSGQAQFAMPGMFTGALTGAAQAIDAPRAAAQGQIPMQDVAGEASGVANMLTLGGAGAAGRGLLDYDPTVTRIFAGPRAARNVDDIENVLRAKYPDVKISVSGSPERGFTLNKIDVPKGKREGGIGTAVMNDLVSLADQQGAVLKLSPSSDFGGSVPRLKDFYARFGFVQNKGKNADLAISESMYRPPSIQPLPQSIDAASERGAQVMDMLRSGRSADVTDAMLDMGDPVLNARLNEYLYRNYDLPMDAASRAARAEGMGLSQQTYHGTPYADITAMRPSEFGAVGPGVYAAGRPVTASDYSRGYGMMTPKETFEAAGERYTPGGNVMPIQTPQNLQSFEDWTAAKMADMQRQGLYSSGFRADAAASQAAADAGFGGVSARNENVVIFDPANVRSRFARFDPRLSHLRNLNAAMAAGVPLGLIAIQPQEEQY